MKLVVAPVYNEVEVLEDVLLSIRRYHKGDILVVDDGSTDGSSNVLEKIDWIKVLSHRRNFGYGKSLIDGLEYAYENNYCQVITIDCDKQHEPHLIPLMFSSNPECDVLSGSRYLTDNPEDDVAPPDRKNINRTVTKIINEITGFNLTDSFCGFKRYRVEALEKLSLDEPGYAMPLQFWIQAKYFNLNIGESPVPRIYKDFNRTFGGSLNDPGRRLLYYKRVIEKELKRWSMSLSSELIQTI